MNEQRLVEAQTASTELGFKGVLDAKHKLRELFENNLFGMSKTSDKKTEKIRDDALRRALSTPPEPKKGKIKP